MNTPADAKTQYFENKDHYLAMRKAFAKSVNDPDVRIHSAHFMFYNALRGKDITCGFTERTNLWHIYNQGWVNLGAHSAQNCLRYWARFDIEKLLAPFGGTVSVGVATDVVANMPKVVQKIEYPDAKTFEEWSREYLNRKLSDFANELLANQKPLDADMAAALNEMLAKGEYA